MLLCCCEGIVLLHILVLQWISIMGPPTVWNLQLMLGFLHFLLYPLLSSSEASSFIRRQKNLPPLFVPTTINITVREGDLAILPCSVKNLGTRQVAWRRLADNQVMTIGSMTWVKDKRVIVEHKMREDSLGVSEWNLIMKNVKRKDSGIYECQMTAKKKKSLNITLTVTGPPARQPALSISGNKYPNLGEEIRLVCNATGGSHIPEDIDWFKEGDKIDSAKYPKIVITKFRSLEDKSLVSQLIIDHSEVSDNGMYICRSSDEEIDSRKVTVIVAGTQNKKRVPRPVDEKTKPNKHGRYRTGTDKTRSSAVESSASGLLQRSCLWVTMVFSLLLYPLSTYVI